ncbi:DNA binding protein [Mycobacterium phage MarkPhew]|uniref:Hydrolase n=1 Tax=Mycobacterium phage MarkPhew TaxID=2725625 RepID=A0A6M3SXB7_9CAUD|nr:DNA binding protein [Mycobacterium phage MarkPhew]QJD50397.1 hydrolase [Mycobacterium phage MarkPhew]
MRTRTVTRAAAAAVALSIAAAAPAVAATAFTFRGTDILSPGDRPQDLVPSLFAGDSVHSVDYSASVVGMDKNTAQAVRNLAAAEQGVSGPIVVAGFSQGAIAVALDKQRVMALPADQRPAAGDLSYVVIGDPTGPNGLLHWLPGRVPVIGAGPTDVPETPYDTIVINREYDGWADTPDRPNLVAWANAALGIVYVHGRYDEADLDPSHVPADHVTTVVNTVGGKTTTYLVPTKFLPLVQPLRDLHVPEPIVAAIEHALRPVVDAGYSRNDAKPAKPVEAPEPRPASEPAVAAPVHAVDQDDEPAAKPAKRPAVRLSPIAKPGKAGVEPEAAEHDVEAPAASSPSTDAGDAATDAPSPADGPRGAAQGGGTGEAGSAADGGASAAA